MKTLIFLFLMAGTMAGQTAEQTKRQTIPLECKPIVESLLAHFSEIPSCEIAEHGKTCITAGPYASEPEGTLTVANPIQSGKLPERFVDAVKKTLHEDRGGAICAPGWTTHNGVCETTVFYCEDGDRELHTSQNGKLHRCMRLD
jgi:hypothetical protein